MSELAEEAEVRDLFERFGRVTRVFLARDRETQRAKGFAFISFADRSDAARACEKMDGCTYRWISLTTDPIACTSKANTITSLQSVIAISFSASSSPSAPLKKLLPSPFPSPFSLASPYLLHDTLDHFFFFSPVGRACFMTEDRSFLCIVWSGQ